MSYQKILRSLSVLRFQTLYTNAVHPGTPLRYFNDREGGWGSERFFGFTVLAKRDILGFMKDAKMFLGLDKNTGIFYGYCFSHQFKSTIK